MRALAVPMTVAPQARASWTATVPTPPVAPWTSTVSPAPTFSVLSARCAVCPEADSAPACSQGIPAGLRTSWVPSARTSSAAQPRIRKPSTSSPTAQSWTPAPTASTTPANSLPGISPGDSSMPTGACPSRIERSTGCTPAA